MGCAQRRVDAARENIMRVLRIATKPIPPHALLPRGARTLVSHEDDASYACCSFVRPMLPVLVPLPRRHVVCRLSSLRVRSDSLRESAVDSGKKKKRSAAPILSASTCLVVFRPLTVLPCAGGHRQLYGKKLTDMMSVFEAIDRCAATTTTTAYTLPSHSLCQALS